MFSHPLYLLKNALNTASFPQITHCCLLCEEFTKHRICEFCQQHFLITIPYSCHCCGLPMESSQDYCGECLMHPTYFDHTISPYIYQSPLADIIHSFKQQHDFFSGKALSELFCQQLSSYYKNQTQDLPEILIPVPLHWRKRWQRGFNQSIFLAHALSKHFSIPLLKNATRNKYRNEQKQLGKKKRIQNVKNDFTIHSTLHHQHIAIVDDVMTTGATVNALSQTLKQAGAKKVTVWALARTPKKG